MDNHHSNLCNSHLSACCTALLITCRMELAAPAGGGVVWFLQPFRKKKMAEITEKKSVKTWEISEESGESSPWTFGYFWEQCSIKKASKPWQNHQVKLQTPTGNTCGPPFLNQMIQIGVVWHVEIQNLAIILLKLNRAILEKHVCPITISHACWTSLYSCTFKPLQYLKSIKFTNPSKWRFHNGLEIPGKSSTWLQDCVPPPSFNLVY